MANVEAGRLREAVNDEAQGLRRGVGHLGQLLHTAAAHTALHALPQLRAANLGGAASDDGQKPGGKQRRRRETIQ